MAKVLHLLIYSKFCKFYSFTWYDLTGKSDILSLGTQKIWCYNMRKTPYGRQEGVEYAEEKKYY